MPCEQKKKKAKHDIPQEWELGTCIRFLRQMRGQKKEKVEMVGRVEGYELSSHGVSVRVFSGGAEFRCFRHLMSDVEVINKELVKDGNEEGVEQLHADVKNLKQRINYTQRKVSAMDWVGTKRSKMQAKLDDMNAKLDELREQKSKAIKSSSPAEKKKYMKEARAGYHSLSSTLRELLDDMDECFDDGMDAGERTDGEAVDESKEAGKES